MKIKERPASLFDVASLSKTEESFGRNIFVDLHLPPISIRPGRPAKSSAHKREMNRRRVARYRQKQEPSAI